MKKEIINIKGLSKKFYSNCVLNDLNFTATYGELIYVYGVNGCGKSTLFKLISDIIKSDKGEITFDNDAEIGALIENPGFLENESIKVNLKFLADFKGNYNEDKINAMCKAFHLDFHNKTKIAKYSVGMRQKVGIIQAFMENQNLILLDEPTRGLDQDSIEQFYKLVQDAKREKKCVIIAAHDELNGLEFDCRYELKNGKLVKDEEYI
ncbi:ATP-binding cassette domain-containing protein [Amedibacillus sp. YH-ame10]